MIDRKTLWILWLFIAATAAAAIWRLSLLPDWTQVPFPAGRDGPHTEHGLWLFVTPLCILLMLALAWGTQRLVSGPDAAMQAHQRNSKLVLLGTGVIATLMQGFVIGRSLGYGNGVDGDVLSRGVIVLVAILIMIQGNSMPKLPWISSRFPAFDLDPWQQVRSRRFAGRMSIAFGLAMIAAALLLPVSIVPFLVMALALSYLGVIVWHALKVKREPSPAP